ncbi:uncharacterized protein IL334_003915 [Kwoniella shivajii]|uniref:Uncharacterized protein n=1 Tax=Kwoniella shivajii TaxID=564305 RepID=A0ABZ1D0M7_9TREE|nr:hypothetical protein IL334_003915 [Kwoniella shivajii]
MITILPSIFPLLFSVTSVYGSAYTGCFDPKALRGGGGVIYDDRTDNCPLISPGYAPYSNSWRYVEQSHIYACRGWEVALEPQFLVGDRQCGYPNVNETLIDPPGQWTWAGCWFLEPSPNWVQVANISNCLAHCAASPYAYSRYNSDLTISCLCSRSQPPYDYPQDCGYGDNFWYTRPVSPSGFVKRQRERKEKLRRDGQKVIGLCPDGAKACNVPGSTGTSYECIDIEYEYESCGGCVHGEFNEDSSDDLNITVTGVE